MDHALILTGVRALMLLARNVEMYMNDELTDEEFRSRVSGMHDRLEEANRLWEAAGGSQPKD